MKLIPLLITFILILSSVLMSQPPQPPELQTASKLLQEQKWDEAETALDKFVKANPDNARGWYLLASARHNKKNYEGAITALRKNLAINENWPGMYNLASALARTGKNKEAFEWLEKALKRGGAFAVNIETDEDFESVRKEPNFKDLLSVVDRLKNPCMHSEKARQFDFWIGDWDVFVGGRKVGENLIVRETGGCTLIENWKNAQGGTGKSINVYDASVDKWKQFYAGNLGGVYLFEGGLEGNMMKFTAETVDSNGAKTLHKFEFTNNEDKTVRQSWETSTDGGRTYNNIWDSIYKKKLAKEEIASEETNRIKKSRCEVANIYSSDKRAREVEFIAADGVKLFGDLYESPTGKSAPLVLLFHQGGGDVRGEYAGHIPKLRAKCYNILAVDLRTGGDRFGSENRTVSGLGDKKYGYCEAYPDLEASLKFARDNGFTGKTVAWGSSFSAALVFQLASKHPDKLAGILAFSPASGGPLEACKPDLFIEGLKVPAIAFRPGSEMNENTEAQLKSFRDHGIETYIAKNGVHGSSMLNPEKVTGDVEEHWDVVFQFLKKTLGSD